VVSSGGGGPSISSPEQAVLALAIIAIIAIVWFWKFAD
jgi:hypothetical protein